MDTQRISQVGLVGLKILSTTGRYVLEVVRPGSHGVPATENWAKIPSMNIEGDLFSPFGVEVRSPLVGDFGAEGFFNNTYLPSLHFIDPSSKEPEVFLAMKCALSFVSSSGLEEKIYHIDGGLIANTQDFLDVTLELLKNRGDTTFSIRPVVIGAINRFRAFGLRMPLEFYRLSFIDNNYIHFARRRNEDSIPVFDVRTVQKDISVDQVILHENYKIVVNEGVDRCIFCTDETVYEDKNEYLNGLRRGVDIATVGDYRLVARDFILGTADSSPSYEIALHRLTDDSDYFYKIGSVKVSPNEECHIVIDYEGERKEIVIKGVKEGSPKATLVF
ncbi:hypothetical protein A2230_09400 [candidate division WOR-1 bacterium RIFOXYA2_FULL_36_21]|uniref:Uncharacterized protein n=1 Tax=candidate division WOR-1 bacterium RIFOXYB2_FULL_36_35 TaxID=1802578 RepID=A0A1F4S3U2_UNCSA|nr:MAG: hypothetical protein A2230_09400 [candidate division WOR-1 bacterium RIFOXYA2_FULL_36_21]OGC15070.1 MAG: hypothetical protein A2290_09220 [candidate division WOR-1 bacterium RIFOXYB2_FULL_36_35]